jgi:hypothetical protein
VTEKYSSATANLFLRSRVIIFLGREISSSGNVIPLPKKINPLLHKKIEFVYGKGIFLCHFIVCLRLFFYRKCSTRWASSQPHFVKMTVYRV